LLFSGAGFAVNARNQVKVGTTTALSTLNNGGGILPFALINDGGTFDLAVGNAAGLAVTKYPTASYITTVLILRGAPRLMPVQTARSSSPPART